MNKTATYFCSLAPLALLSIAGPVEALNINEKAAGGFARAYGYVYSQKLRLEYIEKTYPELAHQVDMVRMEFEIKYPKAERKLADAIKGVIPADEIAARIAPLKSKIVGTSRSESEEFLSLVMSRAKGNVENPPLDFMLAAIFEDSPGREYTQGFRQKYTSVGNPKAKGVDFEMQLPQSWKAEEGNRPNIVQKWTSASGTGLESVLVYVQTIGSERITKADVDEMLKSGEEKRLLPATAKFVSSRAVTIEAQPGYAIEFDLVQERAGMMTSMRSEQYAVFYGGYLVSLQCASFEGTDDLKKAVASYERVKPLCRIIANSIVFPGRYK